MALWDKLKSIFVSMYKPNEIIALASVVTAIATVVIANAALRSIPDTISKEATLEQINDAGRKIDETVAAKIEFEIQTCKNIHSEGSDEDKERCVLDENGNPDGDRPFAYSYISNNKEIEGFVFRILNEYDTMCIGGNEGIFDNNIINLLRGNAFESTWTQYRGYIKKYRKENQSNEAWKPCDDWLDQHRPRRWAE